jgi:hypothetical protein
VVDALTSLLSDTIIDFGLIVVLAIGGILWGRIVYRRRIERWARSKHLTLVDWRPAWFYEGPDAPFRSRYRPVFWIEVEDKDGLPATGWLVFSWWIFSSDVEVEWN